MQASMAFLRCWLAGDAGAKHYGGITGSGTDNDNDSNDIHDNTDNDNNNDNNNNEQDKLRPHTTPTHIVIRFILVLSCFIIDCRM